MTSVCQIRRVATLLALVGSSSALAQTEPESQAEEVHQLRDRLRAAERRIDDLESLEGPEQTEVPIDLDTALRIYAAVQTAGSLDMDNNVLETPPGFVLNDLVFTYGANLDRNMSAYTEIAFEPANSGIAIDLEVVQINWSLSDAFGLVAGRVHAPWSYWANTSLHGEYRFLPIAVPNVLALEDEGGGWQPIHQVGLWTEGTAFMGYWQLSWQAGLSNGRSPILGEISQEGDLSLAKAVNGHLWLESPGGLLIGLGGYSDQIHHIGEMTQPSATTTVGTTTTGGTTTPPASTDSKPLGEHIGNVTFLYRGGRLDLNAEGFVIIHTQSGNSATTIGGFVVAGLQLGDVTPYLIGDFMSVDSSSALYQQLPEYAASSSGGLGVRKELGLRLALKTQAVIGHREMVTFGPLGNSTTTDRNYAEATVQLAAGF